MRTLLPALVAATLVAGGNWLLIGQLDAVRASVPHLAWLLATPFVLAVVVVAAGRLAAPAVVGPPAVAPAPAPPADTSALRLLATLQEEGRLVDFLMEDIAPYSDEQIGAATRGIHESARKALRGCVTIEPILAGAEGQAVDVDAGFDPSAVRLTGNVTGTPPFRGTLQHGGWRVRGLTIPERRGQDTHVLAPAEVELG
jgi:hypothetical protein